MAWLLRVRRTPLISSAISHAKTLISQHHLNNNNALIYRPFPPKPVCQIRNYIAEMHKTAFEGNMLRMIRREIQYEMEYTPPNEPVAELSSFTVEDRPGEQWIRLRGKYGDNEDIKIEVTMFDGSIPISKSNQNAGADFKLHISLIVDISKGEDCDVLQFICSAWPDSMAIEKVFTLKRNALPGPPYVGPDFKELDDELQASLQEFLEERGIDEDLAISLHEYMLNKDKTELLGWLEKVKSFLER
ncbi:hypothetical protein AMTRI_Chr02g263450 [Amborella trichopoda]